jgi:enoyl-CoA hydratase/carnithine racemase
MSNEILFHKGEGIGTITFNRPDKLNALKIAEARSIILKLVHDVDKDQSVLVLLLRGDGRHFVPDGISARKEGQLGTP